MYIIHWYPCRPPAAKSCNPQSVSWTGQTCWQRFFYHFKTWKSWDDYIQSRIIRIVFFLIEGVDRMWRDEMCGWTLFVGDDCSYPHLSTVVLTFWSCHRIQSHIQPHVRPHIRLYTASYIQPHIPHYILFIFFILLKLCLKESRARLARSNLLRGPQLQWVSRIKWLQE